MRCNYACPLTAGPESVHYTKDGADHVPLIILSSVYKIWFDKFLKEKMLTRCIIVTSFRFGSGDEHYFLDFDIQVLGRPDADYDCYAGHIQQEYNHVPMEKYHTARAEVRGSLCGIKEQRISLWAGPIRLLLVRLSFETKFQ